MKEEWIEKKRESIKLFKKRKNIFINLNGDVIQRKTQNRFENFEKKEKNFVASYFRISHSYGFYQNGLRAFLLSSIQSERVFIIINWWHVNSNYDYDDDANLASLFN